MSRQSIPYTASVRDYQFLLFEQFDLEGILKDPRFNGLDGATVRVLLDEAYAFTRRVLGPLNAVGDEVGCQLVDGKVTPPPGFKEAWRQLYENGWKQVVVPTEYGGQGAPHLVALPVEEWIFGANMAFGMYPGLTWGVAELLETFGTSEQKARFLTAIYQGTWAGTMCLTEAHAGSDLGVLKTTATPLPDGTYRISGTKIFISGGDHDMTENVVHLVLARIRGAPEGTKGLSLFIVPKRKVDADGKVLGSNDVTPVALEHKMGIRGSATCTLSLGEAGECTGELVGGPGAAHQGMQQIFRMMNNARLGVGNQGVAVASAAYLAALRYAKERLQGAAIENLRDPQAPRVPIIQHPDVRRMLIDMKARVEGLRALHAKIAAHKDHARLLRSSDEEGAGHHAGQVDLLTPVFKSFATDQAFRITEIAIQTFGGAGYIQESGVEQYCRDVKITSLYEGTNHIQAMDLVGRKLGMNGGKYFLSYLEELTAFIEANSGDGELGSAVGALGEATGALREAAMQLLEWSQSGQLHQVALNANRFLEMMGKLTLGWLLLDQAAISQRKLGTLAEDHPDRAFYLGKVHTAKYFAENVVTEVPAAFQIMRRGDRSALAIPDEAFAHL